MIWIRSTQHIFPAYFSSTLLHFVAYPCPWWKRNLYRMGLTACSTSGYTIILLIPSLNIQWNNWSEKISVRFVRQPTNIESIISWPLVKQIINYRELLSCYVRFIISDGSAYAWNSAKIYRLYVDVHPEYEVEYHYPQRNLFRFSILLDLNHINYESVNLQKNQRHPANRVHWTP